jgi:hypothetical protein
MALLQASSLSDIATALRGQADYSRCPIMPTQSRGHGTQSKESEGYGLGGKK